MVMRYTPEDTASVLANARSVIIIPACGMAVAQTQHAIQELAALLIGKGCDCALCHPPGCRTDAGIYECPASGGPGPL
jgi:NAD/NADP transhydrogenase beta subunit